MKSNKSVRFALFSLLTVSMLFLSACTKQERTLAGALIGAGAGAAIGGAAGGAGGGVAGAAIGGVTGAMIGNASGK